MYQKGFKVDCCYFSILYALLAGTWSDKNGRKPLMFLSIFGNLLSIISYGLNFWFMKEMDWRFLYLEMINDFCGSYILYFLMEYSYIVDVTTVAER